MCLFNEAERKPGGWNDGEARKGNGSQKDGAAEPSIKIIGVEHLLS